MEKLRKIAILRSIFLSFVFGKQREDLREFLLINWNKSSSKEICNN